MSFKISTLTGKLYNDELVEIPFNTNNEMYLEFENWINQGNEVIYFDGTPEEIAEHSKPIVPEEISRLKFKIQIRRSTIYSYDIILTYLQNSVVNELFTQDDKDELIDRLEDAVSFNRYHKDFINLANMLGVSDEIKDEIFIEGNKIQ